MNLKDKLRTQSNTSHSLPTARESEMYVIGSAMSHKGAAAISFEVVRHWHFYFDDNKIIWKAITRLMKSDKQITKQLLYLEIFKKAYFEGEIHPGYLQECIDSCGTGSGIATVTKSALICHRDEIYDTWARREMIDLGATIQFRGFLPGGNSPKMFEVFEKRKQRIEKAYEIATNVDTLEGCKFDPSAPVELPDYTLNLLLDGKQYGIAEQGCIVSVSGPSGSRKTTLLTGLISSAFKPHRVIGFELVKRGKILFFDTEQPKKQFQHTQRRLYNMCYHQNTNEHFEAYRLRKKDYKERIRAIDQKIKNEKEPISMIVIDGILDLVPSMNDEAACTLVIQKIMSWSEETGAILVPVLHDVKSSGKMGGHLGSLLERKQDAEINVTLDENPMHSVVTFRKTRGGPRPRSFQFEQDDKGWPVFANPVDTQDTTEVDNFTPFVAIEAPF